MPFMKNLEAKICTVLEPEVEALKHLGWEILSDAEEAAHREELKLKPELTSAVVQEEARVEAGVYTALSEGAKAVDAGAAAPAASESVPDEASEVPAAVDPVNTAPQDQASPETPAPGSVVTPDANQAGASSNGQ